MAFEKLGDGWGYGGREFRSYIGCRSTETGIHIAFGPVADVSTNPANPIINTRAFSESTERAAELTRRTLPPPKRPVCGRQQSTSPATVAPIATPRFVADRGSIADELRECELVPFQAAIDAGCSLIMTAHVSYPALDSSGIPATLSPIILNDILRKQMGFKGVVCSDSLLMAGVRAQFNEEEMSLAVLNAGVDLLLDLAEPVGSGHLCDCVESGRLTTARVEEALKACGRSSKACFANRPS